MSSNNEQSPPEKTSKTDLLDELESIKGLLDDDLDIDIPILDDVVNNDPEPDTQSHEAESLEDKPAELLDLNSIFDDEVDESPEESIVDRLNLKDLNTNITIPDFKLDAAAIENADSEAIPDDMMDTLEATTPLSPEDPDYEEEQEEMFAEFEMAPPADESPALEEAVDMDLLIQEIVDEFIPTIEDQLRQRLTQCSPAVIKELAKKHLND